MRTTYTIAGQAVAVRVLVVSGSNNVLHLHNDHLGSNSVMSYSSSGNEVGGSRTRYLPFGGYRTAPTQTFTDRGYTGHLHEDGLGLIYMNARYFIPSIGRFASPDTIVPEPANPQTLNRYSYVNNRPLKDIDPTGHCVPGQCESWASRWEYESSEALTVTPPEQYSLWNSSDYYSGCFKCHAAKETGSTILSNEELIQVHWQMLDETKGASALLGGGMIVMGAAAAPELAAVVSTQSCADGDCTNELVTLYRAVRPQELEHILQNGNYGSAPSASGKYFGLTEQGVRQFANHPFNAGQNMTLTQTEIPRKFLEQYGYLFDDVGGAGPSAHFGERILQPLYQIMSTIKILPE